MLITFADGTTTAANLVIGADGIHSVVRSHYLVCLATSMFLCASFSTAATE